MHSSGARRSAGTSSRSATGQPATLPGRATLVTSYGGACASRRARTPMRRGTLPCRRSRAWGAARWRRSCRLTAGHTATCGRTVCRICCARRAGRGDSRRAGRGGHLDGADTADTAVPHGGAGLTEVRIGLGSCCVANGSGAVYEAIQAALVKRRRQAIVKRVGCVGMCHQTPFVEIHTADRPATLYSRVQPEHAEAIVRRHIRPRGLSRRLRSSVAARSTRCATGRNAGRPRRDGSSRAIRRSPRFWAGRSTLQRSVAGARPARPG